jgi:hypothetical protein
MCSPSSKGKAARHGEAQGDLTGKAFQRMASRRGGVGHAGAGIVERGRGGRGDLRVGGGCDHHRVGLLVHRRRVDRDLEGSGGPPRPPTAPTIAIAIGRNAIAGAEMGNNDTAIAVGNPGPNAFQMATENTGALAGGGSNSTAIALGNGTIASAAPGPLSMGRNKAFALGDGSFAEAPIFFPGETAGSGNTAIVVGTKGHRHDRRQNITTAPNPGELQHRVCVRQQQHRHRGIRQSSEGRGDRQWAKRNRPAQRDRRQAVAALGQPANQPRRLRSPSIVWAAAIAVRISGPSPTHGVPLRDRMTGAGAAPPCLPGVGAWPQSTPRSRVAAHQRSGRWNPARGATPRPRGEDESWRLHARL